VNRPTFEEILSDPFFKKNRIPKSLPFRYRKSAPEPHFLQEWLDPTPNLQKLTTLKKGQYDEVLASGSSFQHLHKMSTLKNKQFSKSMKTLDLFKPS
jgi:hypothetical protein